MATVAKDWYVYDLSTVAEGTLKASGSSTSVIFTPNWVLFADDDTDAYIYYTWAYGFPWTRHMKVIVTPSGVTPPLDAFVGNGGKKATMIFDSSFAWTLGPIITHSGIDSIDTSGGWFKMIKAGFVIAYGPYGIHAITVAPM